MHHKAGLGLTAALYAASIFNSGNAALSAEINSPIPEKPDAPKAESVHTGIYELDNHKLIKIEDYTAVRLTQAASVEQLERRLDKLKLLISEQIEINYYFLPIRNVWEAQYKSIIKNKEFKRLSSVESETDPVKLEQIEKELIIAENKAINRGVVPGEYLCSSLYACPETGDLYKKQTNAVYPEYSRLIASEHGVTTTYNFYNDRLFSRTAENSRSGTLEITDYDKSGSVFSLRNFSKKDGEMRLVSVKTYEQSQTASYRSEFSDSTLRYFDQAGNVLGELQYGENGEITARHLFDKNGKPFGTYQEEKQKNPELAENQYLDFLADNLNTWEKYHLFIKLLMAYERDGSQSYIQSPSETLNRITDGAMTGNCLDYAFLIRHLLEKQGHQPFVISLNKVHAACILLTNENGFYHAKSFCNFGVDENGNRFGQPADPEKSKGYKRAIDAINAVCSKYSFKRFKLEEGETFKIEGLPSIINRITKQENGKSNKQYSEIPVIRLVSIARTKSNTVSN